MNKISKKDKEFITNFIKLYLEGRELTYALMEHKNNVKYKKKLELIDKKLNKLLLKYPLIFEKDLFVLKKIFDDSSKRISFIIRGEFSQFLKWSFETLHKNKVIDEKTYSELKNVVSRFSSKSKTPGFLAGVTHI